MRELATASHRRHRKRHVSTSSRLVITLVRTVLTCLIVAALSYWIQGMEMARGLPGREPAQEVNTNPLEWIRTQDGWERSLVLQSPSREQGLVHPLVVAGLQLLGSLLVLLAFPRSARQPVSHTLRVIGMKDFGLSRWDAQEFCTKCRSRCH